MDVAFAFARPPIMLPCLRHFTPLQAALVPAWQVPLSHRTMTPARLPCGGGHRSKTLRPPFAASADGSTGNATDPAGSASSATTANSSSASPTANSGTNRDPPSSLKPPPPSAANQSASQPSSSSADGDPSKGQPNKNGQSTPPNRRDASPGRWLGSLRAFFAKVWGGQSVGNKSQQSSSSRPVRIQLGSIVRLVFNVLAFYFLLQIWPGPGNKNPFGRAEAVTVRIGYSDFLRAVKRNEIARLAVDGTKVTYQLRTTADIFKAAPKELDRNSINFETTRPQDISTPYDTLLANGVPFSAMDRRGSGIGSLLNYALLLLVIVAVLNKMPFKLPTRGGTGRRHSGGSGGNNGNGADALPGHITFDDVAGVDEAKEELQEVVEFLKDPERFAKLGARPPSGVLLVGPPGTGKTLLAKAVAGEAGVPFFSISASEFVELYVGMGALRVRELFAQARKEAPAIVFIDEIDAVAKGRDSRLRSVGNDEREQTLNQLLTELDGFDSNRDAVVICIAATNRVDVLDAALLRPGRFDRRVPVERPDRIGREEILRTHIRRKALPLDADVNVGALASQTAGFTGADLANVVNEAALLAGRRKGGEVSAIDFDAAVLRQVAGLEKKRSVLKGEEKAVVARHEAGHALVAAAVGRLIPSTPQVERLSIIPRSGGALGFTYSPPEEDRALLFEHEIRGQLAMLMGGRAAEALTSGAVSTGAGDDIRRATDLAHRAVAEFGLSKSVGPLSVAALAAGGEQYSMFMDGGGEIGRLVEREVRELCENGLEAAKDVVRANKTLHAALSAELERDERLDGAKLQETLARVEVPASLRSFVLEGAMPSR